MYLGAFVLCPGHTCFGQGRHWAHRALVVDVPLSFLQATGDPGGARAETGPAGVLTDALPFEFSTIGGGDIHGL